MSGTRSHVAGSGASTLATALGVADGVAEGAALALGGGADVTGVGSGDVTGGESWEQAASNMATKSRFMLRRLFDPLRFCHETPASGDVHSWPVAGSLFFWFLQLAVTPHPLLQLLRHPSHRAQRRRRSRLPQRSSSSPRRP